MTLPVVPGTAHVTIGGAIASDVHGKNHHRDGSFARHVVAISLCTPSEGLLELSPEGDRDLFYATLGGMGLTGVVVEATLRVEPLLSGWIAEDIERTDGLEQTLASMAGDEDHRYSVAWLDLLAPGAKSGRAVISRADQLPASSAPGPGELERGRTLERRVRPRRAPERAPRLSQSAAAPRGCATSTRFAGDALRAEQARARRRSRITSSRSTRSMRGTGCMGLRA